MDIINDGMDGENMEIDIDVNIPTNLNPGENPVPAVIINDAQVAEPQPQEPRAQANGNANNNNQFGAVRDRLFHAMLVRIALQYNLRVNATGRKLIEFVCLSKALLLLSSLLFVHLNYSRATTTCLEDLEPDAIKDGVARVEVVRNLKQLELYESYIQWYIREKSQRACFFSMKDVFLHGPKAMPAEMRPRRSGPKRSSPTAKTQKYMFPAHHGLISFFVRAPTELIDDKEQPDEEGVQVTDPLEIEANLAYREHIRQKRAGSDDPDKFDYEFVYRVEYAMLYGVLRLPPPYRQKHGIKTELMRVDSESPCFGDPLTRRLMRMFLGYEDAIIGSLRAIALNSSLMPVGSNSMGYLHDLHTHEHYHFVSNMMGKTSYITAAILMLIFTFAISMLLRFSHHQIFVFIVDLLHMFELQQPLYFPIAPILTVILALVGMEAIMSEVFNDTSTAFYVILIVWIADQYDAICCHSYISKRYWLRFFYMYQFFFYAYQYRFGGQYGGLALLTSGAFILHSMIFFFHHYEMPLILYQDRVQRVLSEIHASPNMGTVEVQTVTVAVRTRSANNGVATQPLGEAALLVDVPAAGPSTSTTTTTSTSASTETSRPDAVPQQSVNPSSVFDARAPASPTAPEMPGAFYVEREPMIPEELVAHALVNEAIDELFSAS